MVIMQLIIDWLSNMNVHYNFITLTIRPRDTAHFNISITCMIFRHLICHNNYYRCCVYIYITLCEEKENDRNKTKNKK